MKAGILAMGCGKIGSRSESAGAGVASTERPPEQPSVFTTEVPGVDSISRILPQQINSKNQNRNVHLAAFVSGGVVYTIRTATDPSIFVIENITPEDLREIIVLRTDDIDDVIAALQKVRALMVEGRRS